MYYGKRLKRGRRKRTAGEAFGDIIFRSVGYTCEYEYSSIRIVGTSFKTNVGSLSLSGSGFRRAFISDFFREKNSDRVGPLLNIDIPKLFLFFSNVSPLSPFIPFLDKIKKEEGSLRINGVKMRFDSLNPHDPNAICIYLQDSKTFGSPATVWVDVGYLPANVAKRIHDNNLEFFLIGVERHKRGMKVSFLTRPKEGTQISEEKKIVSKEILPKINFKETPFSKAFSLKNARKNLEAKS